MRWPWRNRRRPSTPVVLVLVAAVLVGLGSWFLVQSRVAPSGGGTGNAALLDTGRTTEVSGQVSDALQRIFSYSYDNVEASEQAAREVLTGAAVADYEKLFDQVKARAPGQKLVLSTVVATTGVRSLNENTAHLLVFLDQAATRVDTEKSSGSAAVLSVDAERKDGTWKITRLVPR